MGAHPLRRIEGAPELATPALRVERSPEAQEPSLHRPPRPSPARPRIEHVRIRQMRNARDSRRIHFVSPWSRPRVRHLGAPFPKDRLGTRHRSNAPATCLYITWITMSLL